MSEWRRRGAIALIGIQVMVPIALFVQHLPTDLAYAARSDAGVYARLALAPGKPFVNAQYPPAAILLFKALGPRPFRDFLLRLISVQALAQAITVASIFWAWGKRAGWRYLALSAPLLPIVLTRFDLVAVAVTVSGCALVERGKEPGGGVLVALGAFVKVWPAALLPGFAARRQWRAAVTGLAAFAAGSVAWVAYAGLRGPRQVLTYKSSRGWQIESVPGSVLYLFRRATPRLVDGAWRVGSPAGAWSILFLAGLVVTVAWVWWRVLRTGADLAGLADLAAVSALLVWSTLCSPQFIAWVLPWAAIAGARGHSRAEQVTWGVVTLTVLGAIATTGHARPALLAEGLYLGRNVGLVALLAVSLRDVARVGVNGSVAAAA